jgi:UDP-2,3-diacylglucosamine pyrophosphatase LpxH
VPSLDSHSGPARPPRDLVVVSDLHLGRGLDARTKRYHRLEAFFYDDDFRAFCGWLRTEATRRGEPFTLVLNGDVFDLLRIEPDLDACEGRVERRFGPLPTPSAAARMVADILAGHTAFVEALTDLLAAGNDIVLVSGNHDLELQWEPVRDEVRRAIRAALASRGASPGALARLTFESWFHYEPGRIWIEHGCQYDPENAFRFPLRRQLVSSARAAEIAERDMPLGNFFQKYLYNAFGSITFIVPSSRANYRYFRFLLANQPRLLARVARSQGLFLLQLLRRLARAPAAGWQREAEIAHRAELERLAEASGLGERLRAIDSLKYVGADAARAAGGMLRQGAKIAIGALATAVLTLAVFTSASHAIESLQMYFGWKALLSLGLDLTFAALAVLALVTAAVRLPRDVPPRHIREAAERIAALLDVAIVTFGHTHDEVVAPIARASGPAWYFNTGTWLAVFTHDVLIPRERVQYTFLRVRGREGELLQWSPGRDRALPVVLLEEDDPQGDLTVGPADDVPPAHGERPARTRRSA